MKILLLAIGTLAFISTTIASSNNPHDIISSEWQCYQYGEDINISFSIEQPTMQNWVGISTKIKKTPDQSVDYGWPPLKYLRQCGSQDELCQAPIGELTFELGESPLEPGKYVAHLHGAGFQGHTASAVSEPFLIMAEGQPCIQDDIIYTSEVSYTVGDDIVVFIKESSHLQDNVVVIAPTNSDFSDPDDLIIVSSRCGDDGCEIEDGYSKVIVEADALPSSGEYMAVLGSWRQHQGRPFAASVKSMTFFFHDDNDCEITVLTRESCYVKGDDVVIEFGHCAPRESDSVAIYEADSDRNKLGLRDPVTWIPTCDETKCRKSINESMLKWPRDVEKYIAVLVRKSPYGMIISYSSEAFMVVNEEHECSHPTTVSR